MKRTNSLFTHGLNLLVVVGVGLFYSCQKSDTSPIDSNAPKVRELHTAEKQTLQNSNTFAFKAFSELNTMKPADENLFISPLSLSMALAMTYNGADGSTKAGMKKALSLDNLTDEELNKSFQSLAAYLPSIDQTVTFTPSNAIWYSNKYTPQATFVQKSKDYFSAQIQGLNFADVDASKSTMNGWVKEKTQGKIESIVDEISASHVMFLMNAIYFKGTWTYAFDKKQTYQGPFYLANGSAPNKTFMSTKAEVAYVQDADKVLVNLPYGNKQFMMTLIMPTEDKTLTQLMSTLNAENLSGWLSNTQTATKQVVIPKFTVKGDYTKKEFNTILIRLGMGEAFSNQADFSKLLENFSKGDLAISEVAHKTFIEVNEEGTEAAAVTSIGVGTTNVNVETPLVFNRPFVYLIREKDSGAILFMGKLMNP